VPTCSVDECEKRPRTRTAGLCAAHYFRQYRRGTTDSGYRKMHPDTCTVEGCVKPGKRRGWCSMHNARWERHGDPLAVVTRHATVPRANRYRTLHRPGHPLAARDGTIREHRLVLYSMLGPGAHPCHWCGRLVDWARSWPADPDALVVDHLDGDRTNNHPSNLVTSCPACNSPRHVFVAIDMLVAQP
jgi:hypothetical protein